MADADEHEEETFASQDGAGASLTFPQQASACRKGSHIMIKDRACKIVEMSTSKTGKHGHAKCKFMAIDIFDGTKHEKIESSTHNVDVPNVNRKEYQLTNIDDDYMDLMDMDSAETRSDITVPNGDVGDNIRKIFDEEGDAIVTILSAIGKELAIDVKKNNN